MSKTGKIGGVHWKWAAVIVVAGAGCNEDAKPANGSSGSFSSAPSAAAQAHSTSTSTGGEPQPVLSGAAPSATASATPSASATALPTASAVATARPTSTAHPTAAPVATNDADAGVPALPPPVAGSPDAIAADIDALYLPKKTFKAKFKQKYKQKISGNEKDSTGVVFVEKPNKISFRYDAPNKNRIVSDGTSVKVYVADDAQMFEQSVKGTEYPGALSFIMGEGIRTSFTFTVNETAKFDKGPVLVGKPRTETPAYEAALFYVDKDKLAKKDLGAMTGVLILDAQGNRNRFDFSDAEMPDKIDPAEFTFTPPAGTNIQK